MASLKDLPERPVACAMVLTRPDLQETMFAGGQHHHRRRGSPGLLGSLLAMWQPMCWAHMASGQDWACDTSLGRAGRLADVSNRRLHHHGQVWLQSLAAEAPAEL